MEKATLNMKMERFTKAFLKMISAMEKVSTAGQMADAMKAFSRTDNNTAKESFTLLLEKCSMKNGD